MHVVQSVPLAHGSMVPVPVLPPWPDDALAECEAETVVWLLPPTPPTVTPPVLLPALQAATIAIATASPLNTQVFMCSPPKEWFSA
jgi:hypothetical protein